MFNWIVRKTEIPPNWWYTSEIIITANYTEIAWIYIKFGGWGESEGSIAYLEYLPTKYSLQILSPLVCPSLLLQWQ